MPSISRRRASRRPATGSSGSTSSWPGAKEVGNLSLAPSFDPQVLKLKDVLEGGGLRQMGDKVPFLKSFDGRDVHHRLFQPAEQPRLQGPGRPGRPGFHLRRPGETSVAFTSALGRHDAGSKRDARARRVKGPFR